MFSFMFYVFGILLITIGATVSANGRDGNILLHKPVFVNDYKSYASNLNDGNINSAMWWRNKNVMYAVFNLQSMYNVEKVVLVNGLYRGEVPFNIYVGNEMTICRLHRQIKHYEVCKKNVLQNDTRVTVTCDRAGARGQYLVIVKGEFLTVNNTEDLNFFEIEAFGQQISASPPIRRDVIRDKPAIPASRRDFPVVNNLRKNIPKIYVPSYTRGFLKINQNCEPIIWDAKWNVTFALACFTDNRLGRALFFGREWYFWYIMNDEDKVDIRKNFVEWLSPNKTNPKYVDSKEFKSPANVREALSDGDILDFYSYVSYPDSVMKDIKKLLFEGKISLVFDHSSYEDVDQATAKSNQEILDIFNVAYDTTYFTFENDGMFTMKDSDFTEEFIDLRVRLRKLIDNRNYFIQFGTSTVEMLNKMPWHIIEKANLTQTFEDFLSKYTFLMNEICPCRDDPAADMEKRLIISLFASISNSQILINSNYKAPCIDLFPGDFTTAPDTEKVTLVINEEIAETRNPIGYYLPAGGTLKYKVKKSTGSWGMSVGCHSDKLSDKREEWYRYPNIYIDNTPLSESGRIFSSFGGVLWLINADPNASIEIKLENVVPSPFFNIRDENAVSDWDNEQRYNPGLWSQIAGEDLIICEQSSKVRNYSGKYLKKLMESWDRVVRNNYVFSGQDWRKFRSSQVVLDIMTNIGYAHSGYPVCAFDDWHIDLFNIKYLQTKGSWGMCHELGHNQQPNTLWTMTTVVEVTNNVFCLFNMAKEWQVPYYGSTIESLGTDYRDIEQYLNNGSRYEDWLKSPYLQLAIYVQMANNFGLGFYQSAFSFYVKNSNLKADSDEDKLNLWVNVTSAITGMNLVPIFDFWGLPVGEATRKTLNSLPCYLPNDFFMEASKSRERFILKKYPNCLRQSKFYEDFDPAPYTKGKRKNFIKKKLD